MMTKTMTICTLALATVILNTGSARADEIPGGIPYQGILELGGAPVTGSKTLRFELVSAAGDVLWRGDRTVEIVQGRFSIFLTGESADGVSLHHLIAEGHDLFIKIGIRDAGESTFVMFDGMQRITPVAYAIAPAFGGVPIGAVIDWFGKSDAIPHGYALADGHVVSDTASPLHGLALPNLVDKFVRGRAPGGDADTRHTVGGEDSHGHAVNLEHAHTAHHGHDSELTTNNGSHRHIALKYRKGSERSYWYDGGGRHIDNNQEGGLGREGTGTYALARGRRATSIDGDFDAYTDYSGNHAHRVGMRIRQLRTTTNGSTTAGTTVISNVPGYVGLLKLIRIK